MCSHCDDSIPTTGEEQQTIPSCNNSSTSSGYGALSHWNSWFTISVDECKIYECGIVWEEVGGGYEKDNIEIVGQWWDWEGTSSRFNYNCNSGTHRHSTRQSPRHTLHVLVPPAVGIRRHWDRHRHDDHPQINTRRPSAVGRSWALGRRKFNGKTIIRLVMRCLFRDTLCLFVRRREGKQKLKMLEC